jgi:hypothetical protein
VVVAAVAPTDHATLFHKIDGRTTKDILASPLGSKFRIDSKEPDFVSSYSAVSTHWTSSRIFIRTEIPKMFERQSLSKFTANGHN